MTDIADFITAQRTTAKPPGADIRQRWQTRIIARGLDKQGQAGADIYLRDYGKGISTAKVVALAMQASKENCPEIAAGFWIAAYRLATGKTATMVQPDDKANETVATAVVGTKPQTNPIVAGLPPHLQPGAVVTMQPVDATKSRQDYINNPSYLGQPKRDGRRIVIIAGPDGVYYQGRSMALVPSPGQAFDEAFQRYAALHGPFVLDGELVFLDACGGEHRTGAQAAQTNANHDRPQHDVKSCISVFKALFCRGLDLTPRSEPVRIVAADAIVQVLQPRILGDCKLEGVPTAWNTEQKTALCERQRREGREGEVWICGETTYVGGKVGETFVRTKYLEETEVVITALTPTTVKGRRFGAIKISEPGSDGGLHPVGKVGTGFSHDQDLSVGQRILVRHQGRTENGMLWHACFISVVE